MAETVRLVRPMVHICRRCREEIKGDPMPWRNELLCLECWGRKTGAHCG